jgi:hypothetical protein
MPVIQHNPADLFPPYRCYTHATEIRGDSRLLIVRRGERPHARQVSRHARALLDGDLLSAARPALETGGRSDGGNLSDTVRFTHFPNRIRRSDV